MFDHALFCVCSDYFSCLSYIFVLVVVDFSVSSVFHHDFLVLDYEFMATASFFA